MTTITNKSAQHHKHTATGWASSLGTGRMLEIIPKGTAKSSETELRH